MLATPAGGGLRLRLDLLKEGACYVGEVADSCVKKGWGQEGGCGKHGPTWTEDVVTQHVVEAGDLATRGRRPRFWKPSGTRVSWLIACNSACTRGSPKW
jgi:hypothetical protein